MFMLRSTHDALMAEKAKRMGELDARLTAITQERREMADRYLSLLDKYASALEAKAATIPPPRVKREPDEVDTAIDWKAQGDAAVRRHLERFAKAERRRGVEPKEIAQAIMDGDRRSDEDEDGIP